MAYAANAYAANPTGRTSRSERQKVKDQPKSDPLVKRYLREIEKYNRATSDWYEEGENIVKIYSDEAATSRNSRRFALLWSNVETLKPAVYVKTPTVLCSRRYRDRDSIGRAASEMMERATNTTLDLYGVDEVFRMVRDDRLLAGRGSAWVRYEAVVDEYEDDISDTDPESGDEVAATVTRSKLNSEQACVDYVHWQDFGHNVARIWKDVWLVWRIVYKSEEEVAERFGSNVAASLSYSARVPVIGANALSGTEEGERYVKIYELWDKRRNLVSWLAEDQDQFLESDEPPIHFTNFFPCPEPTYATKTSAGLIPKPDYVYYRDQAKEINDLTDKIGRLTDWLIVKGFIPGGPSTVADPLEEVLRDKGNKELFVQVESYNEWTEKGGVKGLIDWLPLDMVVNTLQAAIQARAQLIQDVYQITGIADVLRGQTDPDDTATAVDMRAQTGTRRLRNTKDDIARFCKDISRLVAEVIAEHFSPETLAEITGFKYLPPMPAPMPFMGNMANVAMFPGVNPAMMGNPMMGGNMQMPQNVNTDEEPGLTFDDRTLSLLRDDRMRSFRIDIETDSTLQQDENVERQSRIDFVQAAGNYLSQAVSMVQEAPQLAPTAGELLMFAARGFRIGRNLEETIERDFAALVQAAKQKAQQPAPEDPMIEVAKVQVQGQIENNRSNAILKAQQIKQDAALEVRKQNIDASLKMRQMNLDATAKARDAASRMIGRFSQPGFASPMASNQARKPAFAMQASQGGM
jgi:hypothetical protein